MKDWGHFEPYMTIVSLMKWNDNSHNSINKWKFQLKTNQFLIKIWNIIHSESQCQNARKTNGNFQLKLHRLLIFKAKIIELKLKFKIKRNIHIKQIIKMIEIHLNQIPWKKNKSKHWNLRSNWSNTIIGVINWAKLREIE